MNVLRPESVERVIANKIERLLMNSERFQDHGEDLKLAEQYIFELKQIESPLHRKYLDRYLKIKYEELEN